MKVISIKEQKDGSALLTYSLNDNENLIFKQLAKKRKKKYSNQFINSQILVAIKKYIKEDWSKYEQK
jgi:hypothetical protein